MVKHVNMTKEKQKENRIRVSGFEYACAYIGHACTAQLYAYAYNKNPNPKTAERKLRKQEI